MLICMKISRTIYHSQMTCHELNHVSPPQDALSQAAAATKAAMAAIRKPDDDDPQYKEIGLDGVGAEVRIVLILVLSK